MYLFCQHNQTQKAPHSGAFCFWALHRDVLRRIGCRGWRPRQPVRLHAFFRVVEGADPYGHVQSVSIFTVGEIPSHVGGRFVKRPSSAIALRALAKRTLIHTAKITAILKSTGEGNVLHLERGVLLHLLFRVTQTNTGEHIEHRFPIFFLKIPAQL